MSYEYLYKNEPEVSNLHYWNNRQNMLTNPIYPNIKKQELQFKSARKFWKVDVSVQKEAEKYPQFFEDTVRFVSKTRGQELFGISDQGQPPRNMLTNLDNRVQTDANSFLLLPPQRTPNTPLTFNSNSGSSNQVSQSNMFSANIGGHLKQPYQLTLPL
jgi:hypothetical protein